MNTFKNMKHLLVLICSAQLEDLELADQARSGILQIYLTEQLLVSLINQNEKMSLSRLIILLSEICVSKIFCKPM